jgi:hypothetical protein
MTSTFEEMHPPEVVAAAVKEHPDLVPRWACQLDVNEMPDKSKGEVLMYSPRCGGCDLRYILHREIYGDSMEKTQVVVDADGTRID